VLGLVQLVKCPYCPRGRGIIAADVDLIMRAAAAAAARGRELGGRDDDDSFLVYDSDAPQGRPCPHLMSHVIDVEVIAPREGGADADLVPERIASASCGWDHPMSADVDEFV
jgi:hypothetical protein